jgi:ABC-type amino acid transport substrate-binding protein
MIRSLITAVLAAAGLALAATLPAHAASLEEVKRRGELRVAVDPAAGQPYVTKVGEGYAGFEAELARSLATQLGVNVVFVPTAWPKLLDAVREDQADVALNALEITAQPGVRFTRPYYTASQSILVKKADTAIYGLKDLPGRTVATTAGSVAAAVLANMPKPPKVKAFPDTAAPFNALAAGQAEAVLLESAMVRWQAKQKPAQFRVTGLPLLPRPYGAATRAEDATLVEALNGALGTLRGKGELKALLTRYGLWDTLQDDPAKPAAPVKPAASARPAAPKR